MILRAGIFLVGYLLVGSRNNRMQQLALDKVVGQRLGIKVQNVLQVKAVLAGLDRADLAKAQAGQRGRLHQADEFICIPRRAAK